ncbi:MAG: hypothetical protein DLM73_00325 [Chthoniobacterales bacterium]|nr:MAG: hypothetical protein DLM73_00325 [Chthoniobacterales bacterium]
MKTLRARVALWTVAVVTGVLILFGAGAAWNLRKELVENLDQEIKTEAGTLGAEIEERQVDWSNRPRAEAFFAEELAQFHYVEIHDAAQSVLYRSPILGNQEVFSGSRQGRSFELSSNGRPIRFEIFERGGLTFALGKDLGGVNETLAGLVRAYLFTLPLVVLAVGAGGWLSARRAVAPIQTITAQAEKISASDLHQRIPEPSSADEIGQLAQVLNEMFDRLQRSFEQITRFTSDASHELKTPLALMRAQVETALASPEIGAAEREVFSDLVEQCTQLSQIVDGLLFLSRADDRGLALEQSAVDLTALVRELAEDAEILATAATLTLRCELAEEIVVSGDGRLLRRAAMNLIDNAVKYNRPGGMVILAASVDGREAAFSVRNTGLGLAPESHEKIFERFFRSDLSHYTETAGHGLGLSIAREIARAHGGDVVLLRSDAEWTEFSIRLPLSPARALATAGSSGYPPVGP